MARGEAVFEERDGAPVATRYVGVISDISEEKRAAVQVQDSELQLRLALDAGRMAVWQVDGAGRLRANPALNQLLGYAPDNEPNLEQMRTQYLPGELQRLQQVAAETLARGERFFEVEFRFRRLDGTVRWLTTRAEIRMGPDGAPAGALGVVLDTTERREAEERTRLLAHEVDHRANNLMSVVQGTVMLSQAASVTELKTVIVGRIRALAKAHQLLSEARWVGADMRQLISEELLGFNVGDEARIDIDGEEVSLPAAAAQSLGLVIHELTTNAAKYGALSVPDGRIEVRWRRIDGGRLGVTWRERGGPAVTPPSGRGFGTSLMQRALSGPLDGRVELDWRGEGLAADLELRVGD
jgi:PAS domain S-box-containing protein